MTSVLESAALARVGYDPNPTGLSTVMSAGRPSSFTVSLEDNHALDPGTEGLARELRLSFMYRPGEYRPFLNPEDIVLSER